jgi:CheY-like chemotaxis protein
MQGMLPTADPAPSAPTDTTEPAKPTILLVADDLMFPSRIREGAKPLGYTVRVVATEAALKTALQEITPQAVLVNLTARRYDPMGIITALKADPLSQSLPLLAFAGHVEKEKHAAARAAGADMVAANSSVSLHLSALLTRLLGGERPAEVLEIDGDEG